MTYDSFKGQGLTQLTSKSNWSTEAVNRLKDDLGPFHIKTGVYEIHGEAYHELRPVGWMNVDDKINWLQMMSWAIENFGPTPEDGVWTSGARWYANNARFYFRNIEDRDWFLLRWTY